MADISLEKTLPNNLEAERTVLGAVLLDDKASLAVFEKLQPEDFYSDGHRKIFSGMLRLLASSQPIDFQTLRETLKKADELEVAGGDAYLAGLTDWLPRTQNIEHYAAIVKEKSTLRRIIKACTETTARSYQDGEPVGEVLQDLEKTIFDISGQQFRNGFEEIAPIVKRVYETIEERSNRKNKDGITGLETGFYDLDAKTSGLQPSDLIIVAARPGWGKTSLCLNFATHLAIRKGKKVAIFSLEMSKEQLTQRFVSSEARIDQTRIRSGRLGTDDFIRLRQVCDDLDRTNNIYIDDTANVSIVELRTKVRRLALEKGMDLLIVDYLQLMSGGGTQRYENRTLEIAQISRGLKGIAKELHIPVIAVSQLSRALEGRNRKDKAPKLSDLRESGAIEQDADIVMFIDKATDVQQGEGEAWQGEGGHADNGIAKLIIAKHRNGETCEGDRAIQLAWSGKFTKFENLYRE
ncbi:MAG: replicative DNA helicase [Acidobacteriota bacterium]|nr:replicative DNA helicase [Acidobacteriota bacterium]